MTSLSEDPPYPVRLLRALHSASFSWAGLMRLALSLRDVLVALLSVILLLLAVFWASAFLYGSFYFFYMPGMYEGPNSSA